MIDPVVVTTTVVESVSWWIQVWDVRDAILGAALAVIVAAAAVVSGTNTPTPGSWLSRMYKIIEWLSLTFGKAKDTGSKPVSKPVSEPVSEPVSKPVKPIDIEHIDHG